MAAILSVRVVFAADSVQNTSSEKQQSYLLEVMLVSLEYFYASLLRSKGSHVPDPGGVVHGIGEDV